MEDHSRKPHIVMIVPQRDVKGGIAAVVEGYYGSRLTKDYRVTFIESYCDGSKWDKLKKALRCYREFRRVLRTDRPDLVHVHSSFGPSFWRKKPIIDWAARAGIPVVNHIHGSELAKFYTDAGSKKQREVKKCYGECAAIIALADEWKERFTAIVPEERITVIRNYAVPHVSEPTEESRKNHQVLFLGLIIQAKGCYDMPDMIRRVLKKVPDARFVLCGVGETSGVTEGLTEEEKKHVSFPGWVRGKEKDRILKESSVFLLPSYTEAMPMSILDAESYAMPVVASRVGGIPYLVEDGVNGRLCAPGDSSAFADALLSYLTDEETRDSAGREGLKVIYEKFSLDQHIDAIEDVYRKVLLKYNKE